VTTTTTIPSSPRDAAPMSLVSHALQLGARPRLRISLHETEDLEGDLEQARPLFQLLASRPGREAVIVTVHDLAGGKTPLLFRCQVDSQLLREIARLLKKHRDSTSTSRQLWEGGDLNGNVHSGAQPAPARGASQGAKL
jgi:hypothetical protein